MRNRRSAMWKILLGVGLALAGCGNKKQDSAPAGDCTASVQHAVSLSAAEFKRNGVTDDTVAKIRDVSIARCKEDGWSNAILSCLTSAKTSDDVSTCQQKMSKQQTDNMATAITAAMASQPDQGSGSAEPAPAPPAGELPAECAEYAAMMEKLAGCDKLPAASREALQQAFEASSQAWADLDKLPDDAKIALVAGCKQAAEAVKQTAAASCGW